MYPAIEKLAGIRLVLASKSPRRLHCFQALGIPVEQQASSFAEDLPHSTDPSLYAMATAKAKADEVASRLGAHDYLLVAADTVAVFEGRTYEKPLSREQATEWLLGFSDRWVDISTGVQLRLNRNGTAKEVALAETCRVKLRPLTGPLIEAYLDSGAGMDHCGALALHDLAMILVERYEGDYYNAIGFPMHSFYRHLEALLP